MQRGVGFAWGSSKLLEKNLIFKGEVGGFDGKA